MTDVSPFRRLRARALFPAMLAVALVLMFATDASPGLHDIVATPMGAMLVVYAAMVIVLGIAARLVGLQWDRLMGPRLGRTEWELVAIAVPLGLLSYGGFWLLWVPLSFVAPAFVQSYALEGMPDLLTGSSKLELAVDVVSIVILAPVVEEVFFRGVLLHRWSLRWGTDTGVVLSSLLFAVLHVELVGHFIFGVAMAALYIRTRSLWVSIAAHALNNALAVALSLPDVIAGTTPEAPTLKEFRAEWLTGAIALVIAIALLAVAWRRFGPRRPWTLPYAEVSAAGSPDDPGSAADASGSSVVADPGTPNLPGTPVA